MADLSSLTTNLLTIASETFTDNLSSSIAANATEVPINSATEYATGNCVVLTVDPGTVNEATFCGKKDTGNQFIECVWTEGNTGVGHSSGATIVDYSSATHHNALSKAMAVSHTATGAIKPGAISSLSMIAAAVLNNIYPVGSVYINAAVATNPATLIGFGTWVAYGEGRVPVGKAGSGTFGTLGATGGAETVTLTANQSGLRQHDHGLNDPGHYHQQNIATTGGTGTGISGTANIVGNTGSTQDTSTYGTGITVNNQGPWDAAEAHNNLQPYIVAYMWKRTA